MNYFCSNNPDQDLYGLIAISIKEIGANLSDARVIGVDTETTGLFYRDDLLLMIQIYDGKDNYVIDYQTVDCSSILAPIMANKDIIKIAHNVKFDYKFLKFHGMEMENVYDTMLAEKIIHCGRKDYLFSLKALMKRYYNIEMDKEVRNTFVGHTGVFTKHQVLYGLDDTVKLLDIRDKQLKQIKELELENTLKLENSAALAFADIEYNGMHLDKTAWDKAAAKVKTEVSMLFEELEQELHAGFPEYRENQMDMFGEGRLNTINWDSPAQVLKFMQKFDPKLESAGAPAVSEIKDKHSIVSTYIEYKEKSKLFNAYGPKFYKYVMSDNKVHTRFDQILDTGRVSSRNPNMQQIPADNTYRNAFAPEDKSWVYVSSDFAAQELCIIAYGSQDPVWLKVLREGGDLHSTCAELIFGNKWTSLHKDPLQIKNTVEGKTMRTHVKIINFGLAYGMQAFSLSRSLGITEKEATALIAKYFDVFPKIKGFLNGLGEYGKKHGHIRTYKPFRRIRHFDEWQGKNTSKSDMSKIIRKSKNTPIQGSGADMTKLALIMVRAHIKEYVLPVELVLTVHDEINTIVHKDYAEQWSEKLKEIMEKSATYIVGEGLLNSDPTITNNWEK